MKKRIFIFIFTFLSLYGYCQLDSVVQIPSDSIVLAVDTTVAEPALVPEQPKTLTWNGYLQTDDRFGTKNEELVWQEYRLSLQAEYKPNDRSRFYTEFWIRSFGQPNITGFQNLFSNQNIDPIELNVREAYFDVYNFLFKNLDIRVGRQRIAWGTGDQLNPTDNINPWDMEDIWDFGRHLGSNGIKLTYYLRKFTFTGACIPQFRTTLLPGAEWSNAFMGNFTLPESFDYNPLTKVYTRINNYTDTLAYNKNGPTYAFKVKRKVSRWDLSASYVYGWDIQPTPVNVESKLILDSLVFGTPVKVFTNANLKVTTDYARMNIVGFDFAGSLWNIGVRGEGALFFPEKMSMKMHATMSTPIPVDTFLPDSVMLDDKPYLKFVFGIDYTFKNNIYLNFQYLHGFLHERGTENLNDYFMLGLDWKVCRDKLRLSLLNAALEIDNWNDIGNNYAIMYLPELAYKPADNAEVVLGCHILDGKGSAAFSKVKDLDEVYVKFKYNF